MMKRALFALSLCAALPAQAADKLSVILDWYVNPNHAPLLVAKEKGFFADEGLDVSLDAPADPNDPPKLVAAGSADIGIGYQTQLHQAVDEGIPLMRIGTLIATPLNTVMVLADSPVKSLADLKGRKIGFSVGGVEDALLDVMLRKHGLKLADVTLVNVNFSLVPALLTNQVDAVIGAYRNVELAQLEVEKHPGRAFYVEEEGVPVHDELIFLANPARKADPRLKRFMAGVERGALYLANHPEESWTLFVKGRPELDSAVNKRAWELTLPRFSHSPAALDHGRYLRFAAFLKQQGLIKKEVPLDSYAIELP